MGPLFVSTILFSTTLLLLLLIRIFVVWLQIRRNRQRGRCCEHSKKETSIPTLIVLGSGGHTTEMLLMTKHLSRSLYRPIHYCKASTDSTSLDRLRTAIQQQESSSSSKIDAFFIHDIPRSREVGQSYASSIATTLYAFGFAMVLVVRLRPKLLLCNGPGTCIPLCAAVFLFRVLGILSNCRIVFCESYCRVQTLSLTGKLLYHNLADLFVVHWKELKEKYPNTILTSTFVADER